jgi:hypothetical protein
MKTFLSIAAALALTAASFRGAEAAEESPATQLFARYCVSCHGPAKQEAKVRLDLSPAELAANHKLLEMVALVLEDGEMPPPDERQPDKAAVTSALQSIKAQLAAKRPETVLKRLTRAEYTHAVNDLFQADFDLTELLPPDHVERGFDKFGEAHLMSARQKAGGAELDLRDAALSRQWARRLPRGGRLHPFHELSVAQQSALFHLHR